jgi:DNA-binding CsgD family transcriptional regulator
MDLWKWLANLFRGPESDSTRRSFQFDEGLVESLQDLADREQRSPSEIAASLLSEALIERQTLEMHFQQWHSLSQREQQITALISLNYTNRQIAAELNISPETVKSHVRNILYKFNARSKQELRQALSQWDFSAWGFPNRQI